MSLSEESAIQELSEEQLNQVSGGFFAEAALAAAILGAVYGLSYVGRALRDSSFGVAARERLWGRR